MTDPKRSDPESERLLAIINRLDGTTPNPCTHPGCTCKDFLRGFVPLICYTANCGHHCEDHGVC